MSQAKKRILLIEDDANFLRAFYERLVDEDYEVAVAGKAEGAARWSIDKAVGFDMIISDQRMPGEVGSSFLTFLNSIEQIDDPESIDPSSETYQEIRKRFGEISDDDFKQVLQNLKVHPHIRVILSGYAEDDSIQQALANKTIHKFITKKTPMSDIVDEINQIFEEFAV